MNRRFFPLAAVLLVLAPIVAGVIMTSGTVQASQSSGLAFQPAARSPAPTAPASGMPPGSGTLVALVKRATTMRSAPGGHALGRLTTHTAFGSPSALWVVARRGSWLGVVSTLAGNNHLGWIRQSATTLTRVDWELKVSLAARKLTVLEGGHVLKRYTVAIGAPYAPTPTGHFAVTDRLLTGDPGGPYGCCILALTAKSPHAIQGWSGGNRIAIHSTPETSSIGFAASHGCVRVTLAEGQWLLGHVPLGTPAVISSA